MCLNIDVAFFHSLRIHELLRMVRGSYASPFIGLTNSGPTMSKFLTSNRYLGKHDGKNMADIIVQLLYDFTLAVKENFVTQDNFLLQPSV